MPESIRTKFKNTFIRASKAIFIAATTLLSQHAFAGEPSYTYQLETGKEKDVCQHMQQVFNRNFRDLWYEGNYLDDKRFSADGEFAFPRLPGVEHNDRMTASMHYSKTPSSPEFDAIEWKEGRAIIGAPSGADLDKYSGAKTPFPILIAYFDFDNDGQVDAVMKEGFTEGYSYMIGGEFPPQGSTEYILVWHDQNIAFPNLPWLWTLQNEAPAPQKPIVAHASYQRPFIYKDHVYVATYKQEWPDWMALGIDNKGTGGKVYYKPLKETMSVLDYHFSGKEAPTTHAPIWDTDTVCEYKMKQTTK